MQRGVQKRADAATAGTTRGRSGAIRVIGMTDQSPPTPPTPTEPDERPQPRYGEYAPPGAAPPPPPSATTGTTTSGGAGSVVPQPSASTPRRSRTWDVALTAGLFALGLMGTLLAVITAVTLETTLRQQYELADAGPYTTPGSLPGIQLTIVISHVVLLIAALGVGIALLISRRLAFWVPLTAGVIAALVFWVCMFAVIASDPNLIDSYPTTG